MKTKPILFKCQDFKKCMNSKSDKEKAGKMQSYRLNGIYINLNYLISVSFFVCTKLSVLKV